MRKADALAVALLVIVITIVFGNVLFGGSCPFLRDLTTYHFPQVRILHDIVWGGDFPLWNPFYSAGQPAAANPQYYVFYPGRWLIFLRDFYLGFRLHIVLHVYIAAICMYALIRTLGAGVSAALATAFAFCFGGAILSALDLLPTLYSLAWLPATLLFTWRGNVPIAGIFLGIQTLAFEPGIFIETSVLILAIALWRRDWKPLLIIPSGFAVGAVQLIPTLDLLRHTARAGGFGFDMVAFWSMPPSRLVEMLQPYWFGHSPLTSSNYWGGAAYRQTSMPLLVSIYVGLVVVVAVLTGLLKRDRLVVAATILAALSCVIAFGEHTPLLRFVYDIGFPIPLRFPERFVILAMVALLIASGPMLDRIITDEVTRRLAVRVTIGLFLAYVAAAVISVHHNDWFWMCARAAAVTIILMLPRRTGVAIVAFALADLLPLMPELTPLAPRSFFTPPPVASELRQPSDGYRIFFQPEWSAGPVARRYFTDPMTTYAVIRAGMFPRLPAAWGFRTVFERDIDQTTLQGTRELLQAMWNVRQSGRQDWAEAFMAMANVGYRAAYRPYPNAKPIVFVPVAGNPRYWFADEIVSGGDFARRIARERHSPRAAYVQMPPFPAAVGVISRIVERTNTVRIDVRIPSQGFLVAANTYDEHWAATIDGSRAPLIRTNLAFQGIVVPAGAHSVELRYRNPFIAWGAAVSALAAAAMAFLARRTRRRT